MVVAAVVRYAAVWYGENARVSAGCVERDFASVRGNSARVLMEKFRPVELFDSCAIGFGNAFRMMKMLFIEIYSTE